MIPLCERAKAKVIRKSHISRVAASIISLLIPVTHPIVVELLAALADGCSVGRNVLEVLFHLDHKVPAQGRERSGSPISLLKSKVVQ